MNSRKPIYVMLGVGVLIILTLTYVPYSLFERARLAVTALLHGAPSAESIAESELLPPAPSFDAAGWYAERGEELERHGVLIESLDGRQVYASLNPDQTFNPASLLKLATSLAVLRSLGPEHRFETRVYTSGTTDAAGTLKGKVFVSGTDPVFGDVAASLLARELKARGVKRVVEQIVVTPGFSFNYSESSEDSAKHMAKVMQLKEKGTEVGEAPAGDPLFVLKSHTLREILLYMNAHSNNFVADRLGALVGGPEGLKRFLVEELKLPADQVEVQRASGRERNRMTARGVVTVVRALKDEAERHGLRLEDLMPVASDDAGTLRRRLEGTPLEGAVLGKTGTLTAEVDGGMASLAGVVYTERAGAIVFAIFDQGNRISENRELEDELLTQVVTSQDNVLPISISEERRRFLPPTSLLVEPESLAATLKEEEEGTPAKTSTAREKQTESATKGRSRKERRKETTAKRPSRARSRRGR